jgi:hypothetical protein
MANHLTRVHAAIDRLETPPGPAGEFARDAVFFDVLGYRVIHYSSMLQEYIAVFIVLAGGTVLYRELDWQITILLRHARAVGISLIAAMGVGVLALAVLRSSPWAQLRFTPYDYPAGMLTVAAAFLVSTFLMEHYSRRHVDDLSDLRCDWPWWVASVLGMWLSLQLPGGAYLLVIPSFVYFFVRIASGNAFWASWAGWIVLALLAGPTLTLLVQALGPWKQPVYAILAALLANLAMTAWIRPRRLIRPTVL